jgi:hypothetical protein
VTVRPSWHSVAVEVDDSDPFGDDFELPVRVNEVGTPIDLTGDTAKLSGALATNVQQQSELYAQGVDCELRWQDGVICHACPVYQGEHNTPAGHLCRLMREQETLTTLIAVRNRDGH